MSEYWEECISEAFDEAGIAATSEQIKTVASWVEGAHENYGLDTGLDVASANFRSDSEIALEKMKAANEKRETWENTTDPCPVCHTSCIVRDGWGRSVTCGSCTNGRMSRRY